ncbi:MAG TPA: NAD-binding protein, partial [Polyangiaceae bacterium]|nr:NAD-binding protein [Polyangiaceae bacterium]
SMALTPIAFLILERSILPRATSSSPRRDDDEITDGHQPVVIAGFGRFGQIVGRMLRASGIGTTVLDLDPGMVSLLRRLGHAVYYGDASRPELLYAAGCEHAKLFVIAIDDMEQALELAKMLRKHFPKLRILSRARNREHYYALRRAGVDEVFRETFGSAFELGVAAFRSLGYRAHTAQRLADVWRRHEEGALRDLESLYDLDQDSYFAAARRALEQAERLMRAEDPARIKREYEAGWDNETLRQEATSGQQGPETRG